MNNKRKSLITIFLILLILVITGSALASSQKEINDKIRYTLSIFKVNNSAASNIDPPYFIDEINNLYEKNNFDPIWFNEDDFNESAYQLREVLANIAEEGLNPKLYRAQFLENFFKKETLSFKEKAIADIFLTNSFYLLASHFSDGVLEPENFEKEWLTVKKDINLEEFLEKAVQKQEVKSSLYSLIPQNERYHKLKNKLKLLREIKKDGGWTKVETSQNLKSGMTGESIRNLKFRLKQSQDFTGEIDEEYDKDLKESIIDFQKRHGLKPDGIVGPNTFRALNRDIEEIIRTVEINMERLRWLPKSFGENYIFTNIADYTLQVYENKEKVLEMSVIVGREQRSTPFFSSRLSYLVLNPYWTVPRTIAVEDKLPLIKKDINYISENNFKVLKFIDGKIIEQNYQEINWDNLNKNNFNYYLRQDPGPNNALGRVKFMFPNKFSVYLHDTPNKELFTQTKRNFSSGCIRLEEPLKLTDYLLREDKNWDLKKINSILETNKETTVNLTQKLPIHIIYMTAWVDDQGRLQLRNDIYNRDARLISAFYQIKERIEND